MKSTANEKLHHIVIVGGGAGGLELATKLGDRLGKRRQARITLVDANRTHLWKPLLHEVAAGSLNSNEDELSYLAQGHWHHFSFRLGEVNRIDRGHRIIHIAPVVDEKGEEYIPGRELRYDTLVFAIGSVSNDFGVTGVRQHCHFIDHRKQADRFHQQLLRNYYSAHARGSDASEKNLNIAIAGAGATGVELAAELYSSARQLVEFGLDRIDPEKDVKITIIEASNRILPGLPESLSREVSGQLEQLGIDVITGDPIVEATEAGYLTERGRLIQSTLKVWAAGIRAPGFLGRIDGLETNDRNQLVVRSTLQTINDDDIFAFGDCAACPLNDSGDIVPPRAQAAHQQALMLVKSLSCRLAGRPLPEYRYVDYGSLINLSGYSTVGSLMGSIARLWSANIFIEGIIARLVYRSLYKSHQLALHGPIRVTATTLANLLTRSSRPRMKLH